MWLFEASRSGAFDPATDFGPGIITASPGYDQRCAVKDDGSVWCEGHGYLGDGMDAYDTDQLPRAVPLPLPAVDVVAAWQLTCATLSDASVWCWGLAAPGEPTHLAPDRWRISDVRTIVAGASHFCALKNDGSVWCWGHDDSGQDGAGVERNSGTETPHQVLGLASDVTQIAAGNAHTCARKSDATIWCWGDGQYGQIGNDQAFNVSPVQMLGCE